MRVQHIRVTETTAADPPSVFALLRDGAGWPSWSPIGSFELEREGDREREGIGAIRVFRTGHVTSREKIVRIEPDSGFGYVLLSGMAIRDYRADIDLTGDGRGTTINWHSSFRAKVPGTAWIYRRALRGFIRGVVAGLAQRAASTRAEDGR